MARLSSGTRNSDLMRSRELCGNKSVSEKVFWEYLRHDKFGFRFRTQYRVRGYYLDFYCPAAKVCVEIGWRTACRTAGIRSSTGRRIGSDWNSYTALSEFRNI